jgi:Glycosyl transferases group 1
MKIFVDCHVFDYGFQGTRTYIQGLYLEMIKNRDIDFYFAASNINNLESVFGKAENIFYLQYKSKNKFYRLLIDCPKLIKQNKIDFAHFQYIVPLFKSCKFIVSTHDVLFLDFPQYFPKLESFKNKILFKFSAKKSDIVLTGSIYSKSRIEHYFKINHVHYQVYGVESVFFQEYNKEEIINKVAVKHGFSNYILFTSRHELRKNHYRLLKSFIDLNLYENYHLVLIGDVTFRDINFDTLFYSLDSSIKDKLLIINKVDFNSMLLLLRGAALFVYPSIAEGFGLPPLESVAARIPTICSNTTSMAEFDFFGENFVNPNDIQDIKNKLVHQLNNPNPKRLKELATFVKQKYNWEASSATYIKILNQD